MAKVLKITRMRIDSNDEGATKQLQCTYTVEDSTDSSMTKSAQWVHSSPDFTKTVDALFAECVSGIKTAEGIA